MPVEFISPPRVWDDIKEFTRRWPLQITKAVNTIGNTHYGNASISPDGNGNGTITHNFAIAPNYVDVSIAGDNAYIAKVQSVSTTTITVLIKDSSGADVTSGSYTIYWIAKI